MLAIAFPIEWVFRGMVEGEILTHSPRQSVHLGIAVKCDETESDVGYQI